jgi:hypothetical protein
MFFFPYIDKNIVVGDSYLLRSLLEILGVVEGLKSFSIALTLTFLPSG